MNNNGVGETFYPDTRCLLHGLATIVSPRYPAVPPVLGGEPIRRFRHGFLSWRPRQPSGLAAFFRPAYDPPGVSGRLGCFETTI
jgi:hypothetical protein